MVLYKSYSQLTITTYLLTTGTLLHYKHILSNISLIPIILIYLYDNTHYKKKTK